MNRQIRFSPLRVIGPEGDQLGILPVEEALAQAEAMGMDLVEITPEARPPVAKIMNYGKFKYDQQKAAKASRKKQHTVEVKEVQLRPQIDEHDYQVKKNRARTFVEEKNKVRLKLEFRGRQITHPELGRALVTRFVTDLADIAKVEYGPSMEGKTITVVFAPGKA